MSVNQRTKEQRIKKEIDNFCSFKVEVKQSVKFTLFSKVISTLIKK